MTKNSFFFWGLVDGDKSEETWQVLHEHFEKLSREDDERQKETVITERKASKRR